MANSHALAVHHALAAASELKRLFDRMGNSDAPRGQVLSAYREARKALAGRVDQLSSMRDTLQNLRMTVLEDLGKQLDKAVALGEKMADLQLGAYGLQSSGTGIDKTAALTALEARLDSQLNAIYALAATGTANEQMVLGDESSAGLLSPTPIIADAAKYLALYANTAFRDSVQGSIAASGDMFFRQAISVIDERTTETCVLVNGQVTTMDAPFELRGKPWDDGMTKYGFTDMQQPFHFWCRGVWALVRMSEIGDTLSGKLTEAARGELQARGLLNARQEIHPAFGFSGRG